MRSNLINPRSFYITFLCMTLLLLVIPDVSLAFFGDGDTKLLPETLKNKPVLEIIVWVIVIGALMYIIGTSLFSGGEMIASLASSLGDARKSNEWGSFFRTIAIVLLVLLVIIFIAVFFIEAASKINLKTDVKIG